MGSQDLPEMKILSILVMTMVSWAAVASAATVECTTVTALISTCSTFISYGSPEPLPRSPCCNAVGTMNTIADSVDNRRAVCRCLMSLITTYNPNATAIATLPGFCGLSLGFTINPNTDCNNVGAMRDNVPSTT